MSNPDDGYDEILGPPPLPHVTREMQYVTHLDVLKTEFPGVDVWVSKQFIALKKRLIEVSGIAEANRIMSNNP